MSTENAEPLESGNPENGNGGTKGVSFRLPPDLLEWLDAMAKAGGVNKSQYLVNMVREKANGPRAEPPTPLFREEQAPPAIDVEAVVRREVKALAVLLLAVGRPAEDAKALVDAALSGRLQDEMEVRP